MSLNLIEAFAAGAVLATGLAVGAAYMLKQAMRPLLLELCGNEARARFWVVFAYLGVALTTLFTSLVPVPKSLTGDELALDLLRTFVGALRMGLFGLLGSLVVLGVVVLAGIVNFESRRRVRQRERPV